MGLEEKIARLEQDAKSIFFAGVDAVEPSRAVKKFLRRKGNILLIGEKEYDLDRIKRIFVVGAGKAGFPMAKAVEEILGDRIEEGCVVVKYGYGGKLSRIKILEASHPVPDENGKKAAEEIISLLKKTEEDDLVICLISGGGSAILPSPIEGITLEEKKKVTQLLLECGATIEEINAIRKHLSKLKGGQLAKIAFPSHLHTLILSDVIGDRLDTIASGPTVPDTTTFKDCWRIVEKYNLEEKLPPSVLNHLKRGLEGEIEETPKPGDFFFSRVENLVIGSNILALKAAKEKAESLGYKSLILSSFVEGKTGEVAKVHIA
ncbi:glycerate-2-kinase family protein, partial [Candidatus Aerophobetes bacterium]|nr:glycerate-2-kinase family protein [Candidatus Aerophobetes bacterium]